MQCLVSMNTFARVGRYAFNLHLVGLKLKQNFGKIKELQIQQWLGKKSPWFCRRVKLQQKARLVLGQLMFAAGCLAPGLRSADLPGARGELRRRASARLCFAQVLHPYLHGLWQSAWPTLTSLSGYCGVSHTHATSWAVSARVGHTQRDEEGLCLWLDISTQPQEESPEEIVQGLWFLRPSCLVHLEEYSSYTCLGKV